MIKATGLVLTGLMLLAFGASAVSANAEERGQTSGSLVMFLTQTDPMVAGHGLHFATRMAMAGRPATVVLVGDAGRIALSEWPSTTSAVSGASLQADLEGFLAAGGKVYITPYTLRSFNAAPAALIDGVSLPADPEAIHAHMFESDTQLLVW